MARTRVEVLAYNAKAVAKFEIFIAVIGDLFRWYELEMMHLI